MKRLTRLAKQTFRPEAVKVAVWMGCGGAALALANLLFAGILSADEFGLLSLVQAVLSVGVGIAPIGFEKLAVRGELEREWSGLLFGTAVSGICAAMLIAGAGTLYDFQLILLAVLFLACIAGSLAKISAGFEQGAMRLDAAQAILQTPFLFFAVGSLVLLGLDVSSLPLAILLLIFGYGLSGAVGAYRFGAVFQLSGQTPGQSKEVARSEQLFRSVTFLSIGATEHLLLQLERLAIPELLTVADLGAYMVVWTIVGSPYKLLQGGVGYALLPQLRRSESFSERKQLMVKELSFAALLCLVGGIVLFPVAQWLIETLYGDKYPVGVALIGAVILLGCVRVFFEVGNAAVIALGKPRRLKIYHWAGWVSAVVGVIGAVALSFLGVAGVVIGVALGWASRLLCAFWIAWGSLRFPGSVEQ